jgi:peptidoglycan-N-acetylglucosamine deacetylase
MHWIWNIVSLVTARALITRRPATREVFLTFDDGPHPERTSQVLSLLDRHQARATFFLQGSAAAKHGDLVQNIVDAGHSLGNHSYSHPWFNRIPLREQVGEIDSTDRVLKPYDGRRRHPFRPPHGRAAWNTILLCMARRQRIVLWNRESQDYRLTGEQVISRMDRMRVAPGDVLLFHDDAQSCVDALEVLLPKWKASGLQFAPL